VLFYSPEFAKQTKIATGFMVAYLKGLRDYYDAFTLGKDKEAVIDILVQRLAMKDRDVWANSSPKVVDLNGEVNVTDIKIQAEFYKKEGFVTGAVPDIEKYIDPRFAAAAVKEIGKR
jgi:NitT/TauT family transport system substrate-binding protein